MIDKEYIRPIPQYIAKRIRSLDKCHEDNYTRFYAYLTKIKGELVKITVACKDYKKQWFCKQVAVHGVHSDLCFVRDINYSLMGYSIGWFEEGLAKNRNLDEDNKWYSAEDKYYDPIAVVVNKKFALKFDEYKYSALDKYPYSDVIKYLRIYEQFPQAEYFIKLGLTHLATNKLLLKKTGKDKTFRKWLIQNLKQLRNDCGNYPYFSPKIIMTAYREKIPLLTAQAIDRKIIELSRDYNYTNTISKYIPKKELAKFLEYSEKQNVGSGTYADYIKACEFIGLDMTLEKNKFPRDFKRWHDIRIDEYHTAKALKDEEERKEFYVRFSDVANKYLTLEKKDKAAYMAIIAKSPAELIAEGEALCHCVGRMNYDQKFVREESLIFFIRPASDKETPFVTVEYSLKNHAILQCHGKNNSKPASEVMEFITNKWLPFANRQLKKIQKAA